MASPSRVPHLHPLVLALLAANVGLVWALPVIPAQDLPEHLTYVRIFADYASAALPFHDFYTLPAKFQPYDSVYLLLAVLARLVTVRGAIRLLMSAYVIGTFAGFHFLAAACRGDGGAGEAGERAEAPRASPLTGALASVLVWSPVVTMGFLQYFLCIPLVLLTLAMYVRWSEDGNRPARVAAVILGGIVISSVHLVAAGALGLFVLLYAVCNWSAPERARRIEATSAVLASIVGTLIAWRFYGDVLGARPRSLDLAGAIRDAQGFEFVNTVFNVTWYDPPVTLNYLTWAVLGPFRWAGMIIPALGIVALVVAVWRTARTGQPAPRLRRYLRAALAFSLVSCLLPWGIQNPSEITYLNFRLIALAFALLLPAVPAVWFERAGDGDAARSDPRPRQWALGVFCVTAFLNYAGHALAFGREANVPLRLLARADTEGVLLPLVFHSKSDYFGKGFRLTHFLPMYFTIAEGGIASQFWARYTEHLPIDYRPGKRPAQPDDWSPQNFDAAKHLKDARWVLFQGTTEEDSPRARGDCTKARIALEKEADRVACEGPWCLYKVRK